MERCFLVAMGFGLAASVAMVLLGILLLWLAASVEEFLQHPRASGQAVSGSTEGVSESCLDGWGVRGGWGFTHDGNRTVNVNATATGYRERGGSRSGPGQIGGHGGRQQSAAMTGRAVMAGTAEVAPGDAFVAALGAAAHDAVSIRAVTASARVSRENRVCVFEFIVCYLLGAGHVIAPALGMERSRGGRGMARFSQAMEVSDVRT